MEAILFGWWQSTMLQEVILVHLDPPCKVRSIGLPFAAASGNDKAGSQA
jgi:hypothetical protein